MADKFELDDYGRIKVCLHCEEENLFEDPSATHCIHCGYSLINVCTNYNGCGKQIPPNAAYCPYCGSESHYLRSGLLKSKRHDLYDISDDDLPF